MSQGKVRALKYDVQEVGKHIKSSKKRYFWSLSIGQRFYHFVLDSSLVSEKSKLAINGKVFHQVEENTLSRKSYDHSFIIDGCQFNITQIENSFELRVNNKTFSHMLAQEMSSSEFKDHTVEDNSFELAGKLKQTEAKKITLNLPGMGNAMKKKKGPAVQSDNWNEFAGSSGFPSFFGETEKETKPAQPKVEAQPVPQKIQSPTIIEEVKAETAKIPSAQDFSTLQNLFKTITAYGEYTPKITTEAATPTYDISEIPALPQINLEEFNTMQNLFSTINNKSTFFQEEKAEGSTPVPNVPNNVQQSTEVKVQVQLEKPVETLKPNLEDFNTMQNLFNTLKQPSPLYVPQPTPTSSSIVYQPPQDLSKVDINDFNTLQNLFATGFSLPTPTLTPNPAVQIPSEQEFHTVKYTFTTNTQNKPESIPDLSKVNLNDFNTIQNLFSTNTFTAPKDVLGSTDKANKTQESKALPTKKQAINAADFNTMQNLFATKGGKSQNSFWQF